MKLTAQNLETARERKRNGAYFTSDMLRQVDPKRQPEEIHRAQCKTGDPRAGVLSSVRGKDLGTQSNGNERNSLLTNFAYFVLNDDRSAAL